MGPVAPLRPALLAALTLVICGLLAAAAAATVRGPVRASARRPAHRAAHCTRTPAAHHTVHGRAGSFHAHSRHPGAPRAGGCRRRRPRHRQVAKHLHHTGKRKGGAPTGHGRGKGKSTPRKHGRGVPGRPSHRHRVPVVHHTGKRAGPHSAAAGGGCLNVELAPSGANLELIREATLCLVNRERSSRGEVALRASASLQRAAQGHTESMANNDYFEHLGLDGQTPLDRMRGAGYIYSSQVGYEIGENIAWATGSLATPRAIVAAWMASPDHRANILDGNFRDSAVGVVARPLASAAAGQPGAIYTQDFGVIYTG